MEQDDIIYTEGFKTSARQSQVINSYLCIYYYEVINKWKDSSYRGAGYFLVKILYISEQYSDRNRQGKSIVRNF